MTMQYVLARIFGTNDALFSRTDEQRIFSQVAEVGLGPKLLVCYSQARALNCLVHPKDDCHFDAHLKLGQNLPCSNMHKYMLIVEAEHRQ